jgi:hypothetical protein
MPSITRSPEKAVGDDYASRSIAKTIDDPFLSLELIPNPEDAKHRSSQISLLDL